jgi:hypothetical protein
MTTITSMPVVVSTIIISTTATIIGLPAVIMVVIDIAVSVDVGAIVTFYDDDHRPVVLPLAQGRERASCVWRRAISQPFTNRVRVAACGRFAGIKSTPCCRHDRPLSRSSHSLTATSAGLTSSLKIFFSTITRLPPWRGRPNSSTSGDLKLPHP